MKMELQELKRRSVAAQRHNAHVSTNLETVCRMVQIWPGQTVYWHYGRRVSRSYAYAAFARAEKHGLIRGEEDGHVTRYYLTEDGEAFLAIKP